MCSCQMVYKDCRVKPDNDRRIARLLARKSWQSIFSVIAFLPTDDIKIFESVPEMRQFLFDNIKGIISDAYKDFQQEKKE